MLVNIIGLFLTFTTMFAILGLWGAFAFGKSTNKSMYATFAVICKAVLIIMFCAVSHFKPYL